MHGMHIGVDDHLLCRCGGERRAILFGVEDLPRSTGFGDAIYLAGDRRVTLLTDRIEVGAIVCIPGQIFQIDGRCFKGLQ
ncbi:hypothetical protein D3C84_637680 [compost metagenome]